MMQEQTRKVVKMAADVKTEMTKDRVGDFFEAVADAIKNLDEQIERITTISNTVYRENRAAIQALTDEIKGLREELRKPEDH
jgi:hypothetical protein